MIYKDKRLHVYLLQYSRRILSICVWTDGLTALVEVYAVVVDVWREKQEPW